MNRIGLIIQGPLMSFGRSGDKAHLPPAKLREEDLVDYDCRGNIQKIISDFGDLFDSIVLSTWDSEFKPGDMWPGAMVVSMPDPGGLEKEKASLYKYNNKYRQFAGIRHGITELEKMKEVDYAVRIRSDQYVDLRKLVKAFQDALNGETYHPGMIYVPFIHPATFLISDHYFASSLRDMKKFCDAVLAYDMYEFITSVHREMILKHAYILYRDTINVPGWAYFPHLPQSGNSAETKKIFKFMFDNIYAVFNPEVLRSIAWRGSYFSEQYLSERFSAQDNRPRSYNIPVLFSIDWERYFNFRRKTKGMEPSPMDKILAKIGKFGWTLRILLGEAMWAAKKRVAKKSES